ncbi:glycosyltransferase family 2 protein [Citrobacter braakii]|uniref:glycosyltransferase family 2 protein n=1 Tax=Citrobacter braakii TaxID=57706 RepID=UPI00103B5B1C|nr:glycosyltransferase family A protein [Citrobacter braakii]TCC92558.1 glycosyltransferase family 2 protein [Citrobacter braakii]HAT7502874.1 glycosyltransferase family 2 protein [Citrobacter braakii]
MKISIIVPVYNVENYLRECLESILNQTYADFEVICINDGSTDSSLSIMTEYEFKDKRVRCFSFDNAGLSVARNRGLGRMTGDLCYFMDSDDIIPPYCLEKCIKVFKKHPGVDVVFFNADAFADSEFKNKLKNYNYERNTPIGVYDSYKLFEYFLLKGKYVVSACCYMFKVTSFCGLKFSEGILHEDNLFTTKLLTLSNKKCYVLDDILFNRRIRSGSITTISKTVKHIQGYLFTYSQVKKDVSNRKDLNRIALNKYLLSLLMSASVDLILVSDINFKRTLSYRWMIIKFASPLLFWDFKVINFMRIYAPFLWKFKK